MNTTNEQFLASDTDSISSRILEDMKLRLESKLNRDTKSEIYSQFEESTGLSSKSLRNWLSSKNLPYPQSIEAYYTLFLGISPNELPSDVIEYFKKKRHTLKSKENTRDISSWFANKPLHMKIYRMIKIGHRIEKNVVSDYYGRVGVKCLNDLEQAGLIAFKDDLAVLSSINTDSSISYFLTCAENHVSTFPFGEIKTSPILSTSKFTNFLYEINENDVDELWTELHQAQYSIFEKYSNLAKDGSIIIESTTLLDQLNINKKEVLQ